MSTYLAASNLDPVQTSLPQQFEEKNTSTWLGHCIACKADWLASKFLFVFDNTIRFTTKALEDSATLSTMCRKLDKHILPMMQKLRHLPEDHFNILSRALKAGRGITELAQVATDINYFVSKKFNKETWAKIGEKCCLAISHIAFGLVWLKEIGVANLGKAAASLGNIRLFSFVPSLIAFIPGISSVPHLEKAASIMGELRLFSVINKISIEVFAETILALSYILVTYRVYEKYNETVSTKDKEGANAAILEGLYSVSELAIDGVLLAGCSNILALGSIAAINVILAIVSVGYRQVFAVTEKSHEIHKA